MDGIKESAISLIGSEGAKRKTPIGRGHLGSIPISNPPFKCPECGIGYKRKYDFNLHQLRHRGEERKCYPCPYAGCGKRFTRTYDLYRHEREHLGLNERLPCRKDGCGRDFTRTSSRNRHEEQLHGQRKDFLCPYSDCGRSFTRWCSLERHEERHLGVQKQVICPYPGCGKEFRKYGLKRHLDIVHREIVKRSGEGTASRPGNHSSTETSSSLVTKSAKEC